MRRLIAYIGLTITLSACAGSVQSTGGGGGSANSSSGGGNISLDLTISGAMQGSTTQIVNHDCAGASFGTLVDSWAIDMKGKEYELALMAPVTKTPVTIALGPGAKVLLEINDQKTGTGGWRNVDDSSGTVTIDAGADSGSVDAHNLSNLLPGTFNTRVDLKLKFICPAKK